MWPRIQAIVQRKGSQNDYDVRHIDSAYKTGCGCFFTTDKRDILCRRSELESMLGMRFFHPDDDRLDFEQWLNGQNG